MGRRSIASAPSWRGGPCEFQAPPGDSPPGSSSRRRSGQWRVFQVPLLDGWTHRHRSRREQRRERNGVLGNFVQRIPQTPPPLARNIVPETPVQPDPYRFTIYNVTMSPLSTSRRSATGRAMRFSCFRQANSEDPRCSTPALGMGSWQVTAYDSKRLCILIRSGAREWSASRKTGSSCLPPCSDPLELATAWDKVSRLPRVGRSIHGACSLTRSSPIYLYMWVCTYSKRTYTYVQ